MSKLFLVVMLVTATSNAFCQNSSNPHTDIIEIPTSQIIENETLAGDATYLASIREGLTKNEFDELNFRRRQLCRLLRLRAKAEQIDDIRDILETDKVNNHIQLLQRRINELETKAMNYLNRIN